MKFRVLIVGCGRIAGLDPEVSHEVHATAALADGRFAIAACVDPDLKHRTDFSRLYSAERFSSLQDSLASNRYDVAVISSPGSFHATQLRFVLEQPERPRVVLVEKPLFAPQVEFDNLMQLAHTSSTTVLVNFPRRLDSRYQDLRQKMAGGSWGRLLRINGSYYGGWLNNGSHWVDTVRFLTGDEPTFTDAFHCSHLGKDDVSADLAGHMAEAGAPIIVSSMGSNNYQVFEFDFWFENARIRIENFGDRIIFEYPTLNKELEAVLRRVPGMPWSLNRRPMRVTYNEIATILRGEDSEILERIGLSEVEESLRIVLQTYQLAISRSCA